MLHIGEVQGVLKVGDKVVARIDSKRRYRIEANHTMTHVLNYALREVSVSVLRTALREGYPHLSDASLQRKLPA